MPHRVDSDASQAGTTDSSPSLTSEPAELRTRQPRWAARGIPRRFVSAPRPRQPLVNGISRDILVNGYHDVSPADQWDSAPASSGSQSVIDLGGLGSATDSDLQQILISSTATNSARAYTDLSGRPSFVEDADFDGGVIVYLPGQPSFVVGATGYRGIRAAHPQAQVFRQSNSGSSESETEEDTVSSGEVNGDASWTVSVLEVPSDEMESQDGDAVVVVGSWETESSEDSIERGRALPSGRQA